MVNTETPEGLLGTGWGGVRLKHLLQTFLHGRLGGPEAQPAWGPASGGLQLTYVDPFPFPFRTGGGGCTLSGGEVARERAFESQPQASQALRTHLKGRGWETLRDGKFAPAGGQL